MPANAVNGEQRKREEHSLAQIRNAKYVCELLNHKNLSSEHRAVSSERKPLQLARCSWLAAHSSLLQYLCFAARLGDLLLRGFRKLMRLHGERCFQLAVTQDLHAPLGPGQSGLLQHFRGDRGLAQRSQLVEIHHAVFLAENVREATLRQTPVQRHLSTFKTAQQARTTAGTLALVAAGRSLAHAGSHAASDALLVLCRFPRRSNV